MSATGGGRTAAAIDVGSNSVLLLVVEVDAGGRAHVVDDALTTTRLGSGLRPGGPLDPAGAARTQEAVVAFAARARARGADPVSAFATGAVRRAADGADFARAIERAAGIPVAILSGEREAALGYAAAVHGLGLEHVAVLAVDVGGATTELSLGGPGAGRAPLGPVAVASLALGALALTEAQGTDRRAIGEAIASALRATDLPARARSAGACVVASGGTATALAALGLGLARYDARRVHGIELPVDEVEALAARAPAAGGPIDPGRRAILPAGAAILAAVGRAAGASRLRISDHGVRHAWVRAELARRGVVVSMRALWA